jgi:hypothetical protein|nr:MAG TPA: hypothetical protein [Crassvirales sp.]
MSKYFLKESGEEVKIGDTIVIRKEVKTPLGRGTMIIEKVVTEDNLSLLVKEGILVIDIEKENFTNYIKQVAESHNMSYEQATCLLFDISKTDAFTALYLLLKAASEKAMMHYKGDTGVVVNLHNGKVKDMNSIRHAYSHLPIFPTKEAAERAIATLEGLFEKVYGSKQEDKEC